MQRAEIERGKPTIGKPKNDDPLLLNSTAKFN